MCAYIVRLLSNVIFLYELPFVVVVVVSNFFFPPFSFCMVSNSGNAVRGCRYNIREFHYDDRLLCNTFEVRILSGPIIRICVGKNLDRQKDFNK